MKNKFLIIAVIFVTCIVFTSCDRTEPQIKGLDEIIEVQCGTDLNLENYLNDILEISDETEEGDKEYKLNDLEFEIDCDKEVYNKETGDFNTDHMGEYEVELTVKDEAGNKAKKEFKLVLNPLKIEKGFYVYKEESNNDYSIMGYCSYKNTSKDILKINKIEYEYLDEEDITLSNYEAVFYSKDYLKNNEIGYSEDSYNDIKINSKKEMKKMNINIEYEKTEENDDTSLIVGNMEKQKVDEFVNYRAETIVDNPYNKNVELYMLLAGMYDKNGKLIGVMNGFGGAEKISAKRRARTYVNWDFDFNGIFEKTKMVKGSARVVNFEGE